MDKLVNISHRPLSSLLSKKWFLVGILSVCLILVVELALAFRPHDVDAKSFRYTALETQPTSSEISANIHGFELMANGCMLSVKHTVQLLDLNRDGENEVMTKRFPRPGLELVSCAWMRGIAIPT